MSNLTIDYETAESISARHLRSIGVDSRLVIFIGLLMLMTFKAFPQQHTDNNVDQSLRGSGSVNGSTLGLEIDIPLGRYPGRGIDIPISLNYSSKVWRTEFIDSHARLNSPWSCIQMNTLKYSERSASGWTSSLAAPYIEYTGQDNLYNEKGFALTTECASGANDDGEVLDNAYVKRITVHLPGGESHELRASDTVVNFPNSNPASQLNFNGTFYSVDGTNLRYIENSGSGTFALLLPDGSRYVFSRSKTSIDGPGSPTIRKAVSYSDRHGNTLKYNFSTDSLTDTLGREYSAPFGLRPPEAPTVGGAPQIYSLPGLDGSQINFKLHWKHLNGGSQVESALTDITDPEHQLQYIADRTSMNPNSTPRQTGFLFGSQWSSWVFDEGRPLFNPVVLTKIELPSGLSYRFSYDRYGRIERMIYPTGALETVRYDVVPGLTPSEPGNVSEQANFGVVERKVFPDPDAEEFYRWRYAAQRVPPSGFKITIITPEEIKTERFLVRASDPASDEPYGTFGFGNEFTGLAYEERVYDRQDSLISQRKTEWAKNSRTVENPRGVRQNADWHPRIKTVESYVYDAKTKSGLKAVKRFKYEMESDLDDIQTPVLTKQVKEYGYENAGQSTEVPGYGTDPEPFPTPDDFPEPLIPIRTTESTFLINDSSISPERRRKYVDKNLVGLVTATEMRGPAGKLVTRAEYSYDKEGYSSAIGNGDRTNSGFWDSSKGSHRSPSAYIRSKEKFDEFGNRIEVEDASGNVSSTEFDEVHHAFPVKFLSAVPDSTGKHGSDLPHESKTTFDLKTGLVLQSTDINGIETRYAYDPETLRLIETQKFLGSSPVGSKTEYRYDDLPGGITVSIRSQIDEKNWSESVNYFDGLGRITLTEKKHREGNIFVLKEFDSVGRVSRVTSPFRDGEAKRWTTNEYDASGRIIRIKGPDGTTVTTDFGVLASDRKGTTQTVTDQAGNSRTGVSDSEGNLIRVIEDPAGEALVTDYIIDSMDNIRETIQGVQHRYFNFNSLGRMIYSKQPEETKNSSFEASDPITGNKVWSRKLEYDGNGNVVNVTDARGESVSVQYDALNRAIRRTYSGDTPKVDFFFDGTGTKEVPARAKGKLTKTSNAIAETRSLAFDEMGRVTQHEQVVGGRKFLTTYKYNLLGQLVAETYPSKRRVEYDSNADGELAGVRATKYGHRNAKVYLSSISRNSSGIITRARLGNGRWQSADFNKRGQISTIGLGHSETDKSLLQLSFGYGGSSNNGSLRSQTISFSGSTAPIYQTYTYDRHNRIKTVREKALGKEIWREAFIYDRYGNRRIDAAGSTTMVDSNKSSNPAIDPKTNRFLAYQDQDSLQDYRYDNAGNLTLDADNQRFIYNAENQTTGFFKATNVSSIPDVTYLYDGNGRRVVKRTSDREHVFIYNAFGRLIAEYANKLPDSPRVRYLTKDHLGSTRVITDGAGAVISREDFMAFGESTTDKVGLASGRLTRQGYGAASSVRERYTGYERDFESGLDYAQARYYNPAHGRFTSTDPMTASHKLRNPQSFNRYLYVLNSPYKFVDPLGLISQFSSACGLFCEKAFGGGFDGGTKFGHIRVAAGPLQTTGKSQNREAIEGKRDGNPQILPPQELIAEATRRLVSVALSGEGFDSVKGYLVMTQELSELWISALVGGFSRGFEVGAVAKAVSGVTATSGLTEGASASVTVGSQVDKKSVGGSLSVGRGKEASVATKSFTEKAVGLDIEARAANSQAAARAAGILQGSEFDVVTDGGVVTGRAGYGFFNAAFSREINLIYSRGMAMGRSNTSGKPAVTDQSTIKFN